MSSSTESELKLKANWYLQILLSKWTIEAIQTLGKSASLNSKTNADRIFSRGYTLHSLNFLHSKASNSQNTRRQAIPKTLTFIRSHINGQKDYQRSLENYRPTPKFITTT